MSQVTRERIVEAARLAAAENGGPLSRADFQRITGIGQHHIYTLFPEGGWSEVKELAGLERHPKDQVELSDEDLLEEYHRVASDLGSIPTWNRFSAIADISADVVRRRFGGMQGTLARYRAFLEEHEPDSTLLGELKARSRHEIPVPPAATTRSSSPNVGTWSRIEGPEFGRPIDFRGLRHAPINEQGVVFLFGMLAYELGFIVEAVHAAFPDCEAKRLVDGKRDRWQRVRIEFEYQSRSFRDHGHDPEGCDVIVCWEHNWPECPIEVLELRTVIDDLDG